MASADHRYAAYAWPSPTHSISDTFADHVARGSVNPGTDYKAPWGTPVYAVWDGVVAGTVNSFGGSGGRMIYLNLTDGAGVDYLHLSQINVVPGQTVQRGELIGYSGASGNGSEWYYGAHLHISIRGSHSYHTMNAGNYDFNATILNQLATVAASGGSTPIVDQIKEFPVDTVFKSSTNATLYMWNSSNGSVRIISGTEWTLITSRKDFAATGMPISLTPEQTSALVNGHLVPTFSN